MRENTNSISSFLAIAICVNVIYYWKIPGVFIGRRLSTGGFAESDFEVS